MMEPFPGTNAEPGLLRPSRATSTAMFPVSSLTASIWNKPRVFQERTNSGLDMVDERPAPVLCVSEINLTIGSSLLEPTSNDYTTPSRILYRDAGTTRRLQRYSIAEGDLTTKFQRCHAEAPPRELQIRALEQATKLLSQHAQDSRERAERLRGLLVDRQVDSQAYETLKRERWMEERRQSVVDQEEKTALQHLETLINPAKTDTDLSNTEQPSASSIDIKRHANLIKFLETSHGQAPIYIGKSTSFFDSTRRKTMERVSPMRLRASSTISYPWLRKRHPHAVSLSGQQPHPRARSNSMPKSSSLSTGFSQKPDAHTLFSRTPSYAGASRDSAPELEKGNGTATIYLTSPIYSAVEMPVDTEDISVQIPDYALDLFSRFNLDYEILLQSEFASTSLSAKPATARISPSPGPARGQSETKNNTTQDKISARVSSSSLQVPSTSPGKPPGAKSSRLGRSNSYRQLGALFSIPEALSSRLVVHSGEKLDSKSSRNSLSINSGYEDASSSSTPPVTSEEKEYLSSKIRRRLSAFRLARS